jgi:UDP-glucose 4-epimerase
MPTVLITGGLGFIGSHTARALVDLGHASVLTQHRRAHVPEFLEHEVGQRVFVEPLDCTDAAATLELGRRYEFASILHLAAPTAADRIDFVDATVRALFSVLRVARECGVGRVAIASSIGLYRGIAQTPFGEELPLPMLVDDPIPALKQSSELLAGSIAEREDFDLVSLRISTVWGPLGAPDTPFFALPHLVHAAVHGVTPDFSQLRDVPYADGGVDLCYVKDCARAIASLMTAETLRHHAYNVGDGRPTSNRQVVAAINAVLPHTTVDLPRGRDPNGPAEDTYLDTARLEQDTGYRVEYGLERGVADYIDWLERGHDR